MSENKKRPPWYRFRARAEYDAQKKTYNEIRARILTPEEAAEFDVQFPPSWHSQPIGWVLNKIGVKKLPKGSGVGLVQSPVSSLYTKTYGVSPIADLKKYRTMFRNHPDIQDAVEKQVNLPIGKGFTIKHPNEKVVKYLNKVCDRINLLQHMLVMGVDELVYGNSYTEILWDEAIQKTEQMYVYKGEYYTKNELKEVKADFSKVKRGTFTGESGNQYNYIAQAIEAPKEKKRILGLKDLDPLYMRVRRDSYGNVFGYIQWMSSPPILLDTDSLIHVKYRPKSWGYESAYGTSILMSLIKNNDLLNQFENDAAIWIHSRAVPPLIIKGGTAEKPYTTAQMKDLMDLLAERTATTMIFAKSDVSFEEMRTVAADLNLSWWIDYLKTRRYQALGLPPILMGEREIGGRATAEVLLNDFVTRLQVLQEFIADPIEEYIFWPLIQANFPDETENAEIIWKPIIEEDRNMRSQRLIQLLQSGAVSVNEVRTELGFPASTDPMHDELIPREPTMIPRGVPRAPAPKQPPATLKVPEKPPESRMKMENSTRIKKLNLMKMEDVFREKMMDLVRWTRANLKDDTKLSKNIKEEAENRATDTINKFIVSSYLLGRVKAKNALSREDDLGLTKADLKPISEMKNSYLKSFQEIIDDLIKDKEIGKLEVL